VELSHLQVFVLGAWSAVGLLAIACVLFFAVLALYLWRKLQRTKKASLVQTSEGIEVEVGIQKGKVQ
jgi:hypothetical protein